MAGSNPDADALLEYTYSGDTKAMDLAQSTRKRRHSNHLEGFEKRARVRLSPGATEVTEEFAPPIVQAPIVHAVASSTKFFTPANNAERIRMHAERQPDISYSHPPPNQSIHRNDQNGNESNVFYTSDPHLYMRILSLPILESLSTQIISTLAQGPYSETIRIITEPESDLGQTYATLKSLFDQTKKIYSQQEQWLSADGLNIKEPEQRAIIRITNLATFVLSVYGGEGVSFYDLNDHFVETFTPDDQPLQKDTGELFLNLKTQVYLSAVSQDEQERAKEDILEDLFPTAMDEFLLNRHAGKPLSRSEIEFLDAMKSRREYLWNSPSDVDAIQSLSEKFAWEDFLRSLSAHLFDAYRPLIAPYMKRHALTAPASPRRVQQQPKPVDLTVKANRAADLVIQMMNGMQNPQTPHNRGLQHEQHEQQQQQQQSQRQHSPLHYSKESLPAPTQTAPTQVLYERARQAAASKANPGAARRPGLPSQRRPWSSEEENALMTGLDQVKGPHWSQILSLYGPKGSVNEILKDRNQVQLKDKARNLKLFFLKAGIEVPYYLQAVTGELKTRAPSQAARKEAEERNVSEEAKARANGIMTLAGGFQTTGTRASRKSQSPALSQHSTSSRDGSERFVAEHSHSPVQSKASPPSLSEADQLRQTLLGSNEVQHVGQPMLSN